MPFHQPIYNPLSLIPFFLKGHVAVLNGNYELLAMLGQGGFFGELGLLVGGYCFSLPLMAAGWIASGWSWI